VIRALRSLARLFGIGRILARHDALFLLEKVPVVGGVAWIANLLWRKPSEGRPGERLARAMEELGPVFIKLGQALSIRSDLIGEEVASDLSSLQDRLEPFAGEIAKQTIEEELDKPLEEIFSSFDEVPVAAASIAQVHFAVTTAGREVAVKVLRPGIEEVFAREVDMLLWVAEVIEATQPSMRRLKPVETIKTFEETVDLEMDLRFEAAAAAEMSENFADDSTFQIPEVDWQRTAKRVMTMEKIHGISVDEKEKMAAAGIDRRKVVENAANAFFNMVFRDGFFHADLHPGNLFIDNQGNLIAVDFGITGRLPTETRRYLGEMLLGFLTGNYKRAAEVHFEAGFVPPEKSVEAFSLACRSIAEPILGKPLAEISIARLLGQLFQITETFEMETQPQLLLLQKTMLTAEGVGRLLDPSVNMWELARPLIESWMRRQLGPEAKLREALSSVAGTAERIPRVLAKTESILHKISSEGFQLHPESIKHLKGDGKTKRSNLATMATWGLIGALIALLVFKR
jgi:ubiquinone biosynthesis protein